jgi:hypothetical protein
MLTNRAPVRALLDPSEIQFQPGTWLVRASPIKELTAAREPAQTTSPGEAAPPVQVPVIPANGLQPLVRPI